MTELRWAQEVYTGSGIMSLVQSRCSCYPLFIEFVVGVTNGQEREMAPKSLWCVRLPFIDQEKSLGVHGKRRKEQEGKKKENGLREKEFSWEGHFVLPVGPASLAVDDWNDPSRRRVGAIVGKSWRVIRQAVVSCSAMLDAVACGALHGLLGAKLDVGAWCRSAQHYSEYASLGAAQRGRW
jgi:hypothetical protein